MILEFLQRIIEQMSWSHLIHLMPIIAIMWAWIALRHRDEIIRLARYSCTDECHGNKDNYIYNDYDALQVGHALEQRVKKLEEQIIKYGCCRDKECYYHFNERATKNILDVMNDANLIVHELNGVIISHDPDKQVDCVTCLNILRKRINDLNDKSAIVYKEQ